MSYTFRKDQIDRVSWHQGNSVPCPHCGANIRSHCHRVTKPTTIVARPSFMWDHHRKRKVAYLLSSLYLIHEELDIEDLVA